MRITVLFLSLVSICSLVSADIGQSESSIGIFVPGEPWYVELPLGDWALEQEKRTPDGTGFYYLLVSDQLLMNFSIFLDKSSDCNSGESCRTLYWDNPDALRKDPKRIEFLQRGAFSIVSFELEFSGEFVGVQTNVSAHAYRNGYWLDVHLSKFAKNSSEAGPMLQFLDSIQIRQVQ